MRDVGEDGEKGKPSYTVGGNCKLMQPLWKTVWRFLKKLKLELPHDPAITILTIYPKDTNIVIQRGTCTLMFIAAMSTITKVWKEPRCPSKDEWIEKILYISIYISHLLYPLIC